MALGEREAIKDPRLSPGLRHRAERDPGRFPAAAPDRHIPVGGRAGRRGDRDSDPPGPPGELVEDVEWETLLFFIGLFILVGCWWSGRPGATGPSHGQRHRFGSGADADGGGVRDRRQHPLRDRGGSRCGVAERLERGAGSGWCALVGAGTGCGLRRQRGFGGGQRDVVVGIADRSVLHISFWQWLKYGVPTAAMSLAISIPYVLLRYA